jgi:hypothetical protein
MIDWRALRLTLIVFVLLCIMMTLLAVLLGTGYAQTTLTPGVTQVPGTSSPLGLPPAVTLPRISDWPIADVWLLRPSMPVGTPLTRKPMTSVKLV